MTDTELTAVAEATGVIDPAPGTHFDLSEVLWAVLTAVMFFVSYCLVAVMEGPY
ncbi:hypothetical protein [Corynebacterium lujinxingii]|uniref:Uncharacterized protein n=1 Tax=Corynebacterium lujinxingii TaxID=2763010 RepID=A0A7H0JWQ3_9CORY|nr:hypothetical protein [Corynebacterium lujinxingii]MBC3178117.1 hypothetical protein [Corynebacterium lujinxingii]QNP89469.1 hypothetical protein IAU68_07085 [Corynebacterium lujinxingii]